MYKKLLTYQLLFFSFLNLQATDVIFDLHGVLFNIPLFEQVKHLGMLPLQHAIFDIKNPAKIKTKFFDVLNQVKVDPDYLKDIKEHDAQVMIGLKMPDIMYLWQANKMDGKTALKLTLDRIAELGKVPKYFSSNVEKQLIERAAHAAFDIDTRMLMWKPLQAGIDILKKVAAETDKAGKRKNRSFVLSNMDPEMLDRLQKAYPDIFNLFDGIVTSGETGFLKPDPRIYQVLIKKYDINTKDAVFLDDQQENVLASEKIGLPAILCQNFALVTDQLVKKGIIAPEKYSYLRILKSPQAIAGATLAMYLLAKYLTTAEPAQ